MAIMIKELVKPIKNTRAGNPFSKKMKKFSTLLFCSLLLFLPDGRAGEAGQKFIPGMYEGLMLAVDREGGLLGFYREVQGTGPTKTCSFYLKGKDVGGQASVATWNMQVFPGLLRTDGKDVNLKIDQGREHPGCGLVLLPEITKGVVLERTSEAQWGSLKVVKNNRAPLFFEPSPGKETKSYFIKNDVLGVVSASGEWVKVEFPREGKASIKGWVRSSDMQDLLPP